MALSYTPEYSYFAGTCSVYNRLFHIIDVEDDNIKIYSFTKFAVDTDTDVKNNLFRVNIEQDRNINVTSAANFFSHPIYNENHNMNHPPYCEIGHIHHRCDGEDVINLIKATDILDLGKMNYYENPNTPVDIDKLYLRPITAHKFAAKPCRYDLLDPNVSLVIYVRQGNRYEYANLDTWTKENYALPMTFKPADILCINSGFGKVESLKDCNLIVPPQVSNFMSNLNFQPNLVVVDNLSTYFTNKLKLKVTGPSSANVGEILEFNVQLTNYNNTDTWSNPPDIECYPICDAGDLSHRKLTLKNGVGKFKVDTTNLYSGDTFDVKVGWKYITGDSKVTVTLS